MFTPTYHLRRVNPKNHLTEELILLGEVTKFGRNADNVDVVLTSAVYSNMISRDHAIITGKIDPITRQIVGYKIRDNSLNGTYIDDKRVKDEMCLSDSSVIKFGHMNGAAIKAGVAAPQANAEFSFVFETRTPNRKYIGWEGFERRRTVVCTGDGKFMTETGEDHRLKRKSQSRKEPVSSTTAPISQLAMHHNNQSILPSSSIFSSNLQQEALYQMMHQQGGISPWPHPINGNRPFPQSPIVPQGMQQQMVGIRPNGQFPITRPIGHPSMHSHPQIIQHSQLNTTVMNKCVPPPIRSPPVECDSSVPSPPKNGQDMRTGNADSSSQPSPRRIRDDDEDSFSVPDSPPRAPRPHDLPGRSVTNSPAPPSPRPIEKIETPKEEKPVVIPKKPVSSGKAPKSGGGEKKSNKEVDRLLTDLTEGSFMMQARKRSEGGVGSQRRKMINEGKKSMKKPVTKNKLHRQLSSASSDEESDEAEASGVVIQSWTVPRPSMVGKKASTSITTPKRTPMKGIKGSGNRKIKKDESEEESDPYEESESDGETKKQRRTKKNSIGGAKKEKITRKTGTPKNKKGGKMKKKGSNESEYDSEEEEVATKKMKKDEEEEEYYDTEDTRCDARKCKYPTDPNVHWVQCDACKSWFHNFCVFNDNLPYEGTNYYCGCRDKAVKKNK